MSDTSGIEVYRAALNASMPEQCQTCPTLKYIALDMAGLALQHQVEITEVSTSFEDLVGTECPGASTEGVCGTEKKVCNHPRSPKLLLRVQSG